MISLSPRGHRTLGRDGPFKNPAGIDQLLIPIEAGSLLDSVGADTETMSPMDIAAHAHLARMVVVVVDTIASAAGEVTGSFENRNSNADHSDGVFDNRAAYAPGFRNCDTAP